MKKIIYVLALTLTIVGCKDEVPKDYVTLSGTIANQSSDSLIIRSRTYSKKINVNVDGTFSDTLKVESGNYNLFDGKEGTSLYLKNGYALNLSLDTNKFDETIKYTGNGSEPNNYLAQSALLQEKIFSDSNFFNSESTTFNTKVESSVREISDLLLATKNIDSVFIANQQKNIDGLKKYLFTSYEEKQYLATVLAKGKASPKFVDYENYNGGVTSLDNLKGKYVYIDLWATWCGPCIKEIPSLKEVEKAYHDKNIFFVSISVDKQKDYNTWREMVDTKELTGVQLYAKEDKIFADSYKVSGIPRFILIDPQGNIVNADAPRPSDAKLIDLFNELQI